MPVTYIIETEKSVREAAQGIEEACKRHEFGVLGTHDLQAKMAEKGIEFAKECLVVEICNPHKAKAILDQAMEISSALPCRISVYRTGGTTYLATIPPRRMLDIFDAEGVLPIAAEVEETIFAIMKEAAGRR